jgi:flavodoxin
MNILIVYGTQFGTTGALAAAMASALEAEHSVRVLHERDARTVVADGIDLLIVGAPTQLGGHRLLGRAFLAELRQQGFMGVDAAAFDTHLAGAPGSAAEVVAGYLQEAGCPLVVPPEGFVVTEFNGPPGPGEEERARAWAHHVADIAVALRGALEAAGREGSST